MDFTVDHGAKEDGLSTLPSNVPVTVWVYQLPNEDRAIYFAKRSPMPSLVPKNRSLVLSFVKKFGNRVVVGEVFSAGPEVQQSAVPIWVTKLTALESSTPAVV
jgi:hypothetical protein